MKNLKLTIVLLPFMIGTAGALQTKSLINTGIYGHTSSGLCVKVEETLQQGCSIYNYGPQCTVWIPGSSTNGPAQTAPAFADKVNTTLCTLPLFRPSY